MYVHVNYQSGLFSVKCYSSTIPESVRWCTGYFVTRIFHPNIAKNGEICVNTLKKDWKPTLGLRHVLLVSRFSVPNISVVQCLFFI